MQPQQLLNRALELATGMVGQVEPKHLQNATPCSEWNLRQLINHLVYELLWVPDLLQGKTIAEVGSKYDGDVLGDDIQAAWSSAADKARIAADTAEEGAIVHLSYGDKPAQDYINEMAMEALVHGWDIGRSLNCSLVFDAPIAETVYADVQTRQQDFADSDMYAKALSVGDNAPVQVKLLGLLGREV